VDSPFSAVRTQHTSTMDAKPVIGPSQGACSPLHREIKKENGRRPAEVPLLSSVQHSVFGSQDCELQTQLVSNEPKPSSRAECLPEVCCEDGEQLPRSGSRSSLGLQLQLEGSEQRSTRVSTAVGGWGEGLDLLHGEEQAPNWKSGQR